MLVIADLMVHRGQGGGTQKGPILTEPSTRRLTPSARPYRAGPQSLAASVPRTRREPLRFYRKSGARPVGSSQQPESPVGTSWSRQTSSRKKAIGRHSCAFLHGAHWAAPWIESVQV